MQLPNSTGSIVALAFPTARHSLPYGHDSHIPGPPPPMQEKADPPPATQCPSCLPRTPRPRSPFSTGHSPAGPFELDHALHVVEHGGETGQTRQRTPP